MDGVGEDRHDVYRLALRALGDAGLPFMVGGAYALFHFTGLHRDTKDLDVFVRPRDVGPALDALAAAGFVTELTFPHWLGKAFMGEWFIDVIFNAGNGCVPVDDEWLEHAPRGEVLGVEVAICPAEETIWSKAFLMERERFDGADVAHLLHACARDLDWARLVRRFDGAWRVLLAHLVLYEFVYPEAHVPDDVMRALLARLEGDRAARPPASLTCQGTLLSREQYLWDLAHGYRDARLPPAGAMTPEQVAHWTAAIKR
jgi:hypothetical protein